MRLLTKPFKKIILILGILICLPFHLMAEEKRPVLIYAPPTPSSLPLILSADTLEGVQVIIFENHSQAHSLFLKGEAQMLATGLSVGVRLFRQGIPVKIVNSYVSGMTWLVTDHPVKCFRDLKGMTLHLPFQGSPIEEITCFFMQKEGQDRHKDFHIKYLMFPGAAALLRQGRIRAAVLPEPFVSQVVGENDLHAAFGYKDLWEKHTGHAGGYPQVGVFVHREWAASHAAVIQRLNRALARSVKIIEDAPEQAAARAARQMQYSPAMLKSALERTDFRFLEKAALKSEIKNYYQTLGRPLDETFASFF